jgi:hypothetical protein
MEDSCINKLLTKILTPRNKGIGTIKEKIEESVHFQGETILKMEAACVMLAEYLCVPYDCQNKQQLFP